MRALNCTYDDVFSLGQWCATSMCLKKLGLRSFSGPFDWFGQDVRLGRYLGMISSGFRGFFAKEDMRKLKEDLSEGTEVYMDAVNGWKTRHEFKMGVSFDENYARFSAQLDRRAKRLIGSLKPGRRVLLVHWLAEGHYSREETVSDMRRLRSVFPGVVVDLLVLETEKSKAGVSYEEPEKGVVFAVGDFYDEKRYDPVMGNRKLALDVLRAVHMHGQWRNLMYNIGESIRRRFFRSKKKGRR